MKYLISFFVGIVLLSIGLYIAGAKIVCSPQAWALRALAIFYFTFLSSFTEMVGGIINKTKNG